MARDGERKVGLALAGVFDADLDQRAGVQNRSQGSDPGLVVVLRAEKCQHRVGKMALHQFGCPKLPVFQKFAERFVAVRVGVTAQKLPGRGRRAGARSKQGNVYCPLRKRNIDKRQVTNEGCNKPKAKTSFGDDKRSRDCLVRDDVAETQSEKSRATEIKVR